MPCPSHAWKFGSCLVSSITPATGILIALLTGLSGILLAHECKHPELVQSRLHRIKGGIKWLFNDSPWPVVLVACFIAVSFVTWVFSL